MNERPEQFDFSNLEDQKKFNELSKDKKENFVNIQYDFAHTINKEADKRFENSLDRKYSEILDEVIEEMNKYEKDRRDVVEFASTIPNLDKIMFVPADAIEEMERVGFPRVTIEDETGKIVSWRWQESKKPSDYKNGQVNFKTIILLGIDEAKDQNYINAEIRKSGDESAQNEWAYPVEDDLIMFKDKMVEYLKEQKKAEAIGGYYIPIKKAVVESGEGWQGKNTLAYVDGFGPRLRFNVVLTDLELLSPYQKIKKLTNMCDECNKCVKLCPKNALIEEDGGAWLDKIKCSINEMYDKNPDPKEKVGACTKMCSICYDVCPKNKQVIKK